MVASKSFLDTFYLLELLKWNTDEEHPLTQNDLRKIADSQKLKGLGDAKTFHKRLITLASLCNKGNESKNWSLLYHGVEQDLLEGNSTPGTHVRKIHYKQPITPAELDFIIHQIECSGLFDSERKDTLIELLIHMFGNKFYYDRYRVDKFENRNKPCYFFTNEFQIPYFSKIDYAIRHEKTITFQMAILNHTGKLIPISAPSVFKANAFSYPQNIKHAPRPGSNWLIVRPYNIVFYKGSYYLIGNRILGYYHYYEDNLNLYRYAHTFEVFRIDRIINLDFERAINTATPLHAKMCDHPERLRAALDEKAMIYKNGTAIYHKPDLNFGFIEFKILWDKFPNNFPFSEREDYTFIQDTFGNNYKIRKMGKTPIVRVQTHKKCFIDWALVYINRIVILDTCPMAAGIKEDIRGILEEGLRNL